MMRSRAHLRLVDPDHPELYESNDDDDPQIAEAMIPLARAIKRTAFTITLCAIVFLVVLL